MDVLVPKTSSFKTTQLVSVSFSGEEMIDPLSNSNIKKYIDKFKSFDVQEITGTVKQVSKPVTIESGTITISQESTSASWNISNFDVVSGAKITLDSGEGQWATVNKILKSKGKFTAKIMGTVDRVDVNFTISVLIDVKVVSNPLK